MGCCAARMNFKYEKFKNLTLYSESKDVRLGLIYVFKQENWQLNFIAKKCDLRETDLLWNN